MGTLDCATFDSQQSAPSIGDVAHSSIKNKSLNKEDSLITWLFKWEFSVEKVAAFVIGSTPDQQRGLLARLEKKGLARRVEAPRSQAKFIYLLTPAGLEKARLLLDSNLKYDTDPSHITHSKINHSLAIQLITAQNLKLLDGYESERSLLGQFKKGKLADAAWLVFAQNEVQKIAIENEIESKVGQDLDKMLIGLCRLIEQGDFYAAIVFLSNNERAMRYQSRLDEQMDDCEIRAGQKPKVIGHYSPTTEIRERIHFRVIEELLQRI